MPYTYYPNTPGGSVFPNVSAQILASQSQPTASSPAAAIQPIAAAPTAQFNPGSFGQAGVNSVNMSQSWSGGPGVTAQAPVRPAAPTAPNLKPLQSKLGQVNNKKEINAAMAEYDALSASTQAAGFQASQNAGNIYANRLMQQGINPVASGVVAAQAKMPVYGQLAQIGVQKEQTKLDFSSKADALAAQIAQSMAQLQLGYAQTLTDFNKSMFGYDLDLNKFNASQLSRANEFSQSYGLERDKFDWQKQQQEAARLAAGASGGGGGGAQGRQASYGMNGDPYMTSGYIPNAGPIIPGRGSSMFNPNVYMGGV
jgi:hypothetical protein